MLEQLTDLGGLAHIVLLRGNWSNNATQSRNIGVFPKWSRTSGLKVVGEVKKVGKSRNFRPKVGKSRNFSVFKVGKSRNFISVFVTSLYTGTSYMLVSFVDFEANHLFFQNCTFYIQSVAIEEPYCVLLIANYCLRTQFRLN